MDECLSSIQFNATSGDLIVSSSYLTYQHWIGFVGHLTPRSSYLKTPNDQRGVLMLSSLKPHGKHFESGVCTAKWVSEDRVLVGTDNAEITLLSKSKSNSSSKNENEYQKENGNANGNRKNEKMEQEQQTSESELSSSSYFEKVFTKQEHDSFVNCLAVKQSNGNGGLDELAVSGSDDARVKLWNLAAEQSTRTLTAHEYSISSITLNPHNASNASSHQFISCAEDNKAIMWDTRKAKPAFLIKHQLAGHPSASDWSTMDANLIAFGSETGQVGVYDLRLMSSSVENNKPFQLQQEHTRLVRQLKFHPAKRDLIASASEDCRLLVNKMFGPSVQHEAHLSAVYAYKHKDYVTDLDWSPLEQKELVSCSWDGRVVTHQIDSIIE